MATWLLQLASSVPLPPQALAPIVAAMLVAVAALVGLSSARALRRAGTTVSVDRPTTDRRRRAIPLLAHPPYVALTLLSLGLGAAALNTLWALVRLPPLLVAMQRGVTLREERYLERKFRE